MNKIIKNAVKCLKCGDIIESVHRHDFVTCSCGNVSVDGGKDYLRRCFQDEDSYIEMFETEEVIDDAENISDEDIMNLEMKTGEPVVYTFDENLDVVNKEKLDD